MSDEPYSECSECGKISERLLSGGAGLIFKGEGFYITDYRSEDYKKAASSDKESVVPSAKAPESPKGDSSSSSEVATTSDKSSGKSSKSSSSG